MVLEYKHYVIDNLIKLFLKLFDSQCTPNIGQRYMASPLKMMAKTTSFYKEVMNWNDRPIQKIIEITSSIPKVQIFEILSTLK